MVECLTLPLLVTILWLLSASCQLFTVRKIKSFPTLNLHSETVPYSRLACVYDINSVDAAVTTLFPCPRCYLTAIAHGYVTKSEFSHGFLKVLY
jgi:hypothetical protein